MFDRWIAEMHERSKKLLSELSAQHRVSNGSAVRGRAHAEAGPLPWGHP
jgi:hypothetical protein